MDELSILGVPFLVNSKIGWYDKIKNKTYKKFFGEVISFMEIKPISIEEYNKAVEEKQKCFLVFTKENCSVCGRLIPILEKISDEYKDHPEMHYYNMEIHDPDARALFKSWQLAGVPQTCIINDGEFQEALPGALAEQIYRDEINKLLGIKKKGFGAKLKSLFGGK